MNWYVLVAGMGLFLFGMKVLEDALRDLAGRSFRTFLRRSTSWDIPAVLAGFAATLVLQSSTVVSVMMLAFVGAGMVSLRGAVAIILGSNLGSTSTGWIVATFGFKFALGETGMVLVGVCGMLLAMVQSGTRREAVLRLLLGFGMLLYGLDHMKHSVDAWAKTLDASPFAGMNRFALVGIGFVVAAAIHSSGGAMMIALSGLNSGVFGVADAAAFMVGADLGTTVTAIFGSIGGAPDKKRVAAAHFYFNLIANAAGFALLDPLLAFIQGPLGVTDPLFALTTFHTGFNVVGVILFIPFIGLFARGLNRMFRREEAPLARYLVRAAEEVPEAGLAAAARETAHLLGRVVRLNRASLELPESPSSSWLSESAGAPVVLKTADGFAAEYDRLKQLEGLLLEHFARMQRHSLDPSQVERIESLLGGVRLAVTSAKMIKDVRDDLHKFRQELHAGLDPFLKELARFASEMYARFDGINPQLSKASLVETLTALVTRHHEMQSQTLRALYRKAADPDVPEWEMSTLLNVNRAIHGSGVNLVHALRHFLLDPAEVKTLESIEKV